MPQENETLAVLQSYNRLRTRGLFRLFDRSSYQLDYAVARQSVMDHMESCLHQRALNFLHDHVLCALRVHSGISVASFLKA